MTPTSVYARFHFSKDVCRKLFLTVNSPFLLTVWRRNTNYEMRKLPSVHRFSLSLCRSQITGINVIVLTDDRANDSRLNHFSS